MNIRYQAPTILMALIGLANPVLCDTAELERMIQGTWRMKSVEFVGTELGVVEDESDDRFIFENGAYVSIASGTRFDTTYTLEDDAIVYEAAITIEKLRIRSITEDTIVAVFEQYRTSDMKKMTVDNMVMTLVRVE